MKTVLKASQSPLPSPSLSLLVVSSMSPPCLAVWDSCLQFLSLHSFNAMYCQAHSGCIDIYCIFFLLNKDSLLCISANKKDQTTLLSFDGLPCFKYTVFIPKANPPSAEYFFSFKVGSELAGIYLQLLLELRKLGWSD